MTLDWDVVWELFLRLVLPIVGMIALMFLLAFVISAQLPPPRPSATPQNEIERAFAIECLTRRPAHDCERALRYMQTWGAE